MKNFNPQFSASYWARKTAVATSCALLGVLAFAGIAQADADTGLRAWAKQADASVDDVMVYPAFAVKRGLSGRSVFEVTIDRYGRVIDSEMIENVGDRRLRSAARRVLQKADFPALPSDYSGEDLRFSLRLNYIIAGSAAEARALMRAPEVRGEEISSGTPIAGRVTILSQASD